MTISDRKAREKEQRRKAILTAAEKRFAREGYNATQLDSIADDVEISKGTIYLYFKNKEDLFFSMIDEKISTYYANLTAEIEQVESLENLIQRLVTYNLEHYRHQHHFIRLIMSEQVKVESQTHKKMRHQFLTKRNEYLDGIESKLAQYLPAKSTINPRSIALTIVGAVNQVIMDWLIQRREPDLEKTKQDIIHIIVKGVKG
ncbi:MAG: TetR/AcrR family transcriptional regulator [Fidelibacterota bacterium]